MVTLGERLREQRDALSASQTDLGRSGGVTKQAQINYEKGARFPDARYLAAVADRGVDVLYVLTGRREMKPMTQSLSMSGAGRVAEQGAGYSAAMTLSDDERDLVLRFRAADDEGRAAVLQVARAVGKRS